MELLLITGTTLVECTQKFVMMILIKCVLPGACQLTGPSQTSNILVLFLRVLIMKIACKQKISDQMDRLIQVFLMRTHCVTDIVLVTHGGIRKLHVKAILSMLIHLPDVRKDPS